MDREVARPRSNAFNGRRRGHPLTALQARQLEDLLARQRLDLSRPAPARTTDQFTPPVGSVRMEIGFGGGEHLHQEAGRHPDSGFIGVEPFVNGVAKLAALCAADPRPNLLVHDDDATVVLDWLPAGCLDGIDLFYPDPWPKKRHHKRRFVNPANLDRFARVLKPGAAFRFASDIGDYVDWTVEHAEAHPAFSGRGRPREQWREPYDGWPGTRYEAKALKAGRVPSYLWWRRA